MRLPILALLAFVPTLALADDHCAHSAPRQLQLDLTGVKKVRVETHQFGVDLRAGAGPAHSIQAAPAPARRSGCPT